MKNIKEYKNLKNYVKDLQMHRLELIANFVGMNIK